MEDRWLSVEEMASYLGVSKDTIYIWISDRSLPAHKVGKLWKFKTKEVDQWIKEGGAANSTKKKKKGKK